MKVILDSSRDALGIIDVQPTFMPGGALATPDGNEVIAPVNRLLWKRFQFKFASQDWHPPGNITFASNHKGYKPFDQIETDDGPLTLWPDHAVQGLRETELHCDLASYELDVIIRKGTRDNLQGYSAFSDLGGQLCSGLAPMLRERGIKRIFLAGLALDVCVAASAKDAVTSGFETFIVEDACRASDLKLVPDLKSKLRGFGVRFLMEGDISYLRLPV